MTQSHGDINFSLAAYGTEQRQIPGQFVYVKESAQPVIIRVHGQGVLMRAGDKSRYVLPFDSFEIENPNGSAVAGVLVVGQGDYNRIIVSGQITAATGILTASGTYEPDTTRELSLAVWPRPNYSPRTMAAESASYWATIDTTGGSRAGGPCFARGKLYALDADANNHLGVYSYDANGNRASIVQASNGVLGSLTGVAAASDAQVLGLSQHNGASAGGNLVFGYSLAAMQAAVAGASLQPDLSVTLSQSWQYPADFTTSYDPFAGEYLIGSGGGYHSNLTLAVNAKTLAHREIKTAYWQLIPYDSEFYLGLSGDSTSASAGVAFVPRTSPETKTGVDVVWGGSNSNPSPVLSQQVTGGDKEHLFWRANGSANAAVSQWTLERLNYTNSLRVTPAKCGGALLSVTMKDAAQFIENTANVTLADNANGSVTLKGEVIRAALAAFLGGEMVPTDYLDHVTGIKATPQGSAQWGGAWVDTQTRGETFAAAGIADDFTVTLPGQITITADASI